MTGESHVIDCAEIHSSTGPFRGKVDISSLFEVEQGVVDICLPKLGQSVVDVVKR